MKPHCPSYSASKGREKKKSPGKDHSWKETDMFSPSFVYSDSVELPDLNWTFHDKQKTKWLRETYNRVEENVTVFFPASN